MIHDFRKSKWGHVVEFGDHLGRLSTVTKMDGHGPIGGRIEVGDYILVTVSKTMETAALYYVASVKYERDPPDMFWVNVVWVEPDEAQEVINRLGFVL